MAVPRQKALLVNQPIYQGSGSIAKNGPGIRVMLALTDANKDIIFNNKEDVVGFGNSAKLPRRGLTRIDITNFVTSLEWQESADEKWISGTVQLDNKGDRFSFIPRGARIEVYRRDPLTNSVGKVVPYFTMFVWERNYDIENGTETISWDCNDRLFWLSNTTVFDTISYKKDKKSHKKGWTLQQILRDLAKRFNFTLGVIDTKAVPLGTTFSVQGAIGDVVLTKGLNLYKQVSKDKNTYQWDMRDGKLNLREVTTLSIKDNIYFFPESTMLETVTREEQQADDKFYTQLVIKPPATAATTKNVKGKKVRRPKKYKTFNVNPTDPTVQLNFGVVPYPIFGDAQINGKIYTTKAGVQAAAQKLLDEEFSKPTQKISFTTRGVPGIWCGSKVYLNSEILNAKGVFTVSTVSYTLQEGQLTQELDILENLAATLTEAQVAKIIKGKNIRY